MADLQEAEPETQLVEKEPIASEASDENPAKKRRRQNTLEEKRRMRNARKKRKRARKQQVNELQAEVRRERKKYEDCSDKLITYRLMSRSFWERWQWELRERKQAMLDARIYRKSHVIKPDTIQEIDPEMLVDPENGRDLYVGRGSFGVVKLQLFRGMMVAVKELLPRTNLADVLEEAKILSRLCHPFLPYLFGVCTHQKPYRIVLQFHEFAGRSMTLSECISKRIIEDVNTWLDLCAQLLEAFQYLHDDVNILHNDLTTSNILLTDSTHGSSSTQIIVIDFGKSTHADQGKHFHLSDIEKSEYTRRFLHMAPEVIDGVTRQTKWSDMYSVGGVLYKVIDNRFFDEMPAGQKENLVYVARKCRSTQYYSRFTAKKALQYWQLEIL